VDLLAERKGECKYPRAAGRGRGKKRVLENSRKKAWAMEKFFTTHAELKRNTSDVYQSFGSKSFEKKKGKRWTGPHDTAFRQQTATESGLRPTRKKGETSTAQKRLERGKGSEQA